MQKNEITFQSGQETVSTSNNGENNNLSIATSAINLISAINAWAYGNISFSGGGNSMKERGFCYNTSTGPTIANDTVQAGAGAGIFSGNLSGLSEGTTYYVRVYAMKSNGDIFYGNELSFTTLTRGMPGPGIGTVTDYDGNVYHTLTYGTQVWMVENLKTTHYRDGSDIPNVTDNTAWINATSGAYCDYDNNPSNSADYGRLYNLYAVKDSRNLAPAGWHIPNYTEWNTLFLYLGGAGIASGRMKEAGFAHWDSPNTGADNSSGLTALGSGWRTKGPLTASVVNLKRWASFWSSSSSISPTNLNIHAIFLDYNTTNWYQQLGVFSGSSSFGYSVRCIKD